MYSIHVLVIFFVAIATSLLFNMGSMDSMGGYSKRCRCLLVFRAPSARAQCHGPSSLFLVLPFSFRFAFLQRKKANFKTL